MRFIPVLALLLVAAAPAKKKKPIRVTSKPIPIAQVMSETVHRGTDWYLDEHRASILGMSPNARGKKLILDGRTSVTQHAVIVTLAESGKAEREFLISSTTAVEFTDGQPSAIDGYTFRVDDSGRFIAGLRAHGKVDEIEQVKLDPRTSEAKKLFEAVLKTVQNHSTLRSSKK